MNATVDIENENVGKINVFIIGLRGYTQNYGGWEALAHGMIDNWKDKTINFFAFEKVSNIRDESIERVNDVTCIRICIDNSGSSAMMKYDAKSTVYALDYIKKNNISNPIIYYLGVRIGPMVYFLRKKLKKAGIVLMENPAGLEWKRTKWNKLVQIYLAISAYMMAKAVDYLICDSKGIREVYKKMIKSQHPIKEYVSYGTYPVAKVKEKIPDKVAEYFNQWGIEKDDYFLILGRFVPENNYEMMIKGFIKAKTTKKLVIVCNYKTEIQSFHEHILKTTKYPEDSRIKMVGTMYDREILNYLRQYAIGYIHGHSVGGTNPGLLEAMSATDVCLLYNCIFNKEVGEDAALYFKDVTTLANRIDEVSNMTYEMRNEYGVRAKRRMQNYYSWEFIVDEYARVFKLPFSRKNVWEEVSSAREDKENS